MEGCENKPQPCWYGIVPDKTNFEEAASILQNLGYSFLTNGTLRDANDFQHTIDTGCIVTLYTRADDNKVATIEVTNCFDTQLGDWILSHPNETLFVTAINGKDVSFETKGSKIWFIALGGEVFSKIKTLFVSPPLTEQVPVSANWERSTLLRKYCQIQLDIELCNS